MFIGRECGHQNLLRFGRDPGRTQWYLPPRAQSLGTDGNGTGSYSGISITVKLSSTFSRIGKGRYCFTQSIWGVSSDEMEEFSGRRRGLGQSKRKAVGTTPRSSYFIDTNLELVWMVSSLTQFLKMKYLG